MAARLKKTKNQEKRNSIKEVLFVYMSPDHKDYIKSHAKKHNLSMTQLVEAIIGKFVADNLRRSKELHV